MIDITKLNTRFRNKKDIIIETIIDHYGREYEQLIKDRLSNLLIDFSSLPSQEYKFLQKHGDQLNERSKLIIESRYLKYKQAEKIAWEEVIKSIRDYVEKNLSIKCSDEDVAYMFSNSNFEKEYIDSQILNDSETHKLQRDNVLEEQIFFKNHPFLKDARMSQEDINKFMKYKNQVQKQYQITIIEKSQFCKNVFKDFVKRWETPIPAECFTRIAFKYDAFTSSFTVTDDFGKQTIEPYIIMRYLKLKNAGTKCFDTNIIHEVIHSVEIGPNNETFGLRAKGLNAEMANEVKTQLLAIKIVKELHDLGVFILDDPNDYIIQGQSAYEWLFPLTQDFFERNEQIILDCAINNEPHKMVEYFGKPYIEFNNELIRIFDNFMYQYKNSNCVVVSKNDQDLISNIINSMEQYKKENKIKKIAR